MITNKQFSSFTFEKVGKNKDLEKVCESLSGNVAIVKNSTINEFKQFLISYNYSSQFLFKEDGTSNECCKLYDTKSNNLSNLCNKTFLPNYNVVCTEYYYLYLVVGICIGVLIFGALLCFGLGFFCKMRQKRIVSLNR